MLTAPGCGAQELQRAFPAFCHSQTLADKQTRQSIPPGADPATLAIPGEVMCFSIHATVHAKTGTSAI
jgi:hypothetical protein